MAAERARQGLRASRLQSEPEAHRTARSPHRRARHVQALPHLLANGALLSDHVRDQRLLHVVRPESAPRRRAQRHRVLVKMLEAARSTHLHISDTRAELARTAAQRAARASLAVQAGPRQRRARAHGALADARLVGVPRALGLSRRGPLQARVPRSQRARHRQLAVQEPQRLAQARAGQPGAAGQAGRLRPLQSERAHLLASSHHVLLHQGGHHPRAHQALRHDAADTRSNDRGDARERELGGGQLSELEDCAPMHEHSAQDGGQSRALHHEHTRARQDTHAWSVWQRGSGHHEAAATRSDQANTLREDLSARCLPGRAHTRAHHKHKQVYFNDAGDVRRHHEAATRLDSGGDEARARRVENRRPGQQRADCKYTTSKDRQLF